MHGQMYFQPECIINSEYVYSNAGVSELCGALVLHRQHKNYTKSYACLHCMCAQQREPKVCTVHAAAVRIECPNLYRCICIYIYIYII